MNKENKKLGRGLSSLFTPSNNRNDNLEDKTHNLLNKNRKSKIDTINS